MQLHARHHTNILTKLVKGHLTSCLKNGKIGKGGKGNIL
jgi:hypothetical protein